jgi:hypothetical protein
MLERQSRLNEVYNYLHDHFNVHTKGEFADLIGYARAYVSSALNGNEKYLTDKLFRSICESYPDIFDINYLLTGEGELLKKKEQKEQQPIDNSSLVNALLARADNQLADKQEIIDGLRRELKQKDDYIALLKQQVITLQAQLHQHHLQSYPFEIGVAEHNTKSPSL